MLHLKNPSTAQKRKAPKVNKSVLPKRKKGSTGDAVSIASVSTEASIKSESCNEEDASTTAGGRVKVEPAESAEDELSAAEVRRPVAKSQSLGKVTHYSRRQLTKTETRAEIVRWVSESARPFDIVQDPGFLRLMKAGRPEYYIPSPSTVARDVRIVFARARQQIAKLLGDYDGTINIATDAWTAPNHKTFVALTSHIERKGVPLCLVLDVVEVAESHSGANLAACLAKVLNDFGIADKILGITCDNASYNDVMVEWLAKTLNDYTEVNHTRCFLHIVTLCAKSIIKQFDVQDSKPNEPLDDAERALQALAENIDVEEQQAAAAMAQLGIDGEVKLESEKDDDIEGWIDEIAILSLGKRTKLEADIRPVKLVLVKLRRIAFKIINPSTEMLPAWKQILTELAFSDRIMPRDVSTRWKSTYDMLSFASEHRLAIDMLTSDPRHGLQVYKLNEEEWTIAEQLSDILKVLKDATEFFSRSTPNLATVIPAMGYISDRITATIANNQALSPAIKASLRLGKKTLYRYYSFTDACPVVLHPRHKLSYFKDMGWEQKSIDDAKNIVRDLFEGYYKQEGSSTSADSSNNAESSHIRKEASPLRKSQNLFDNLLSLNIPAREDRDELERYLSTDPVMVEDALQWWHERRDMFPCLSRMALDYLTIPATSADAERVFSHSRHLLFDVQSRLPAQSTRASICLGSWGLLGLLKDSDIIAAIDGLPDVEGDEPDIEDGWDRITL